MMPMHHVTHLMVASVITSPTFWWFFSSVYSSLPQPPDSGKSNYSPEKRENQSPISNLAHRLFTFKAFVLSCTCYSMIFALTFTVLNTSTSPEYFCFFQCFNGMLP